eukprot:CAMPEP_0174308464 /NCGR_PEP_ID=MMETSP0810-20121108/1777_1 /TAXON_ID=73025 ORGANISM="Eutreptiella gymnastica-like, Strain CCMP1594" /NCGR_SAMPLE_ID=MMETSP0810 /ASSEMBLY_ACC=CAM_ASM_000659 /LENGTH=87 /DNA_ID=CAMNT_0015415805 /DNA_START=1871 /DNA_END=2134 /DNA_ORIENTATION=-
MSNKVLAKTHGRVRLCCIFVENILHVGGGRTEGPMALGAGHTPMLQAPTGRSVGAGKGKEKQHPCRHMERIVVGNPQPLTGTDNTSG